MPAALNLVKPLAQQLRDDAARAWSEPDWEAIDRATCSVADFCAISGESESAVRARIARGALACYEYPSRKHEGKVETRIRLDGLSRAQQRGIARLRQRNDSSLAQRNPYKHIAVRENDGRIAATPAERLLIEGIFLDPKRPRAGAQYVFERVIANCIRCHGGPLVPVERGTARGRFKMHRCWNAGCGFAISYRTVARICFKAAPSAATLAHEGINAWVNKCGRYMKRDWSHFAPNEEVFGDHHECDIFVWDPEHRFHRGGGARLFRPWLSAWQDIGSCVVAYRCSPREGNADLLSLAFRAYALRYGLPDAVVTDNGQDYRSKQFESLCGSLGVEVRNTLPSKRGGESHGKSKPIERFFGTMERQFIKPELPGWCGAKPEERPPDFWLKEKAHQEFIDGERQSTPFLTYAEFLEKLGRWFEHKFLVTPGARLNASPLDAHNRVSKPLRSVGSGAFGERALDVLLIAAQTRKVGRNGVSVDGRTYWSSELFALEGLPCEARVDPMDASKVIVRIARAELPTDARGRKATEDKIVIAYHDALIGKDATKEDIREAKRRKKQQLQVVRAYVDIRAKAAAGVSTLDEVLAERAAAAPPPEAQQAVVNGTPVITEGHKLAAAIEKAPKLIQFRTTAQQLAELPAAPYIVPHQECDDAEDEPMFSQPWEVGNGTAAPDED